MNRLLHRPHLQLPIILSMLLVLGGCASMTDLPPGTVMATSCPSPVLERQAVTVAEDLAQQPPSSVYHVGAGDILYINVNGLPQLGSPEKGGSRVDGAGRVHLPLIGAVEVAGLSVAEIADRLRQAYAPYLQKPWVVVEVAEYRSQPLHLLGQFNAPGTYYMDRPLSLLEGISLGKGLPAEANLAGARLIREQQTVPVDLYRLMREGASEQNVWLRPGDSIFIPDNQDLQVFVFGEVKQPGPVEMPSGQLYLSQALAAAGLNGASDNEEHIRIIRSLSPTRGELMVVDISAILAGETVPFPLHQGDIIYVPRSGIGNWNQAIREVLPSLQLISSILQPFVQIEVLRDND